MVTRKLRYVINRKASSNNSNNIRRQGGYIGLIATRPIHFIIRTLLALVLVLTLLPASLVARALPTDGIEPLSDEAVYEEDEAVDEGFDPDPWLYQEELTPLESLPSTTIEDPEDDSNNGLNFGGTTGGSMGPSDGGSGSGGFNPLAVTSPTLTSPFSSLTPVRVITWQGHTYAAYNTTAHWPVASSFCRVQHGHLVSVTTASENSMLHQFIKDAGLSYTWLGADYAQDYWRWGTNEAFSYNNFVSVPISYQTNSRAVMYAYDGTAEQRTDAGITTASWPVAAGKWTAWTTTTWSPTSFVCEWNSSYNAPAPSLPPYHSNATIDWADPVDLSTGAQKMELSFLDQSAYLPFKLDLSYRSDRLTPGEMGRGWYHNFEEKLSLYGSGFRYFSSPSSYVEFDPTSTAGVYTTFAEGRAGWVLSEYDNPEGRYELIGVSYELNCNYERWLYFDLQGRLRCIKSRTGDLFYIVYNANGQKETVYDTSTRDQISLFYDSEGLLTKAALSRSATERYQVTFTYNASLDLIAITDTCGYTSSFTYDAAGRMLTGTDASAVTYLTNTYDSSGRVVTQDDGLIDGRMTSFAYTSLSQQRTQVVATDREGHSATFVFDDKQRLTSSTDRDGNTASYTYDASGNRVSETDGNGATTTTAYDGYGRVVSMTDPLGNTTSASYDTRGNMLTTTAPDGAVTTNTFDATNRLVSTTDAKGAITQFGYYYPDNGRVCTIRTDGISGYYKTYEYSYGRIWSETDAERNWTDYTYTKFGRISTVWDKFSRSIASYTYDDAGRMLTETDALGNTACYAYDARGNTVSYTDPLGAITSYAYDANGLLVSETDATEGVTYYTRDAEGRITAIEDAEGRMTYQSYSPEGRLTASTDGQGNTTTYAYDGAENLVGRTSAEGATDTYTYDVVGRLTSHTDATDVTLGFSYDACGRIFEVTDAEGNTTSYVYDAVGSLVSVTDALGDTTSLTYDARKNLLSETDALGAATSYTYNKNNLLTSQTQGGAVTTYRPALTYTFDYASNLTSSKLMEDYEPTRYAYDSDYRFTSVTDPAQKTSSQAYDAAGNIISVTNALGGQSTYTYDAMGRITQESTPSGGTCSFTYDAAGYLTTSENARGDVRTYTYDGAGRLVSSADTEGEAYYTYDADGRLIEVGDVNGSITRVYDAAGRVIEASDAIGSVTGYEYDERGLLKTLTYPDGSPVTYTYDTAGRMASVTDWAGRQTAYSYDAAGNLIKTTRPNGTVLTQQYDGAGRLVSSHDEGPYGAVIDDCTYSYYGNLTDFETSFAQGGVTSRSYDATGRLKEQDSRSGALAAVRDSWEYTFDAMGNITYADVEAYSHSDTPLWMSYDVQNRLTKINNQDVTYDADGNMTSYNVGSGPNTLSYDSANRLTTNNDTTYTYDILDNRISRMSPNEGEGYYSYDAREGSNNLLYGGRGTTYHVYGLGLIGSEGEGGYITYHFDAQGSITRITDINGTITDTFAYNPYGKVIRHSGQTQTPFHFNGKYGVVDDGDGLLYMRARYYSPTIARFINADMLKGTLGNPKSLNRYIFANGNPVLYADPTGMSAAPFIKAGHITLDALGFIPGFGAIFDGANCIWYLSSGDYENASLSGIALIPGLGDTAGLLKYTSKGIKAVEAASTAKSVPKAVDAAADAKGVAKVAEASTSAGSKLPPGDSQLKHIFADRKGHIIDTPTNRTLLEDATKNPANNMGKNAGGLDVYAYTQSDGTQVWVYTLDEMIQNGGVNITPWTKQQLLKSVGELR